MDPLRILLSSIRQADNDFSLIEDGDHIAIGLSGGKDSLCLVRLLSVYRYFSKKDFVIMPVFLDLGFEWNREKLTPLKEFCSSLGCPLHIEDSTFVYDVLKAHTKQGKHLPCSICSKMKKAAINAYAKREGYNKVAFAHHSDDAIETLLMNAIHGGRMATFEPKMHLERANITFIRPLIYAKEKDIIALSNKEKMPITDTCCPANKKTDREEMKKLLSSLYKKYPESEDNFRLMLINYEPFSLYWKSFEWEAKEDPSIAIRPIISASDMRGTLAAKRKRKENEENYLVCHHHRRVGEFSFLRLSKHHLFFFGLDGPDDVLAPAIKESLRREVKKATPLKATMKGHKKIASSLGMKRIASSYSYEGKYLTIK